MISCFQRLFRRPPAFRFRILVVCRANITRSPFVEGLLRQRIEERYPEICTEIGLASAGVQAFRHAAADPVMRYLAQQHGVDLLPHRSQPLSARLLREADVIFTLEEAMADHIQRRFRDSEDNVFALPKFGNSDRDRVDWDVSDPTGQDAEAYEAFVAVADREVDRILTLLEGDLLNTRDALVLIGLPGAGKTTLGRRLAEALDWEFLDSDARIEEREGCSLQDIVSARGYEELLRIEEEVVCGLSARHTVIATGGSVITSTAAMTHLRQLGRLIRLHADTDTLLDRLGDTSTRGLAKPEHQSLEELFAERNRLLVRWADQTVKTDDPDIDPVEAILPFGQASR